MSGVRGKGGADPMSEPLSILEAMYPGPRIPREWWVCVNEISSIEQIAYLFTSKEAAEAYCEERYEPRFWGTHFHAVHMIEVLP